MRAAIATGVNAPLALKNLDIPQPGAGEVLVKVTACGVCFSDLNLLHGHYPFARFPVVPGHEITGLVTAVGPGVTWPEVGTAVGAQFLYDTCGHCDYCVRGDQILCPAKRITGVVTDGGYAEYALLKAGFVTPLPAGLDPVAAAPLMCAGLTAFNGLRQGGVEAGARVAVVGLGGVGSLAVRYAVAMGARVAVVGRSRRGEHQAKALGAELFVATEESDPATALKAWDGGANLVLNAAPSTEAAAATLGGLAPDGTLLLCGYGPAPLTLPTQPMILNRLHVAASPSGSPHDLRDTLAFSAAHGILPDVTPITLDQAPQTLAAMADGTARGRSVITFG
ncbi:alcohol dehydrogenase catalytic domain-containing protein [Streptomyces chromofuscus]|uniref:alcohol dehydrogenase n=1 Tax=Streptomyces chromofuscus TaxID=42881 RepID=A0A7M2T661_STRCW|nr:alcohol dehydrogenase catalytic domain-containing protein [Streptomyces chromofuscus]QOV43649.1 alcohol dehydrogenase catalytic domain-containing protein [Streptomyces chromofuscus]GGT11142.1 alcohol dehydrogenase [Streptomyces chromofuscus]